MLHLTPLPPGNGGNSGRKQGTGGPLLGIESCDGVWVRGGRGEHDCEDGVGTLSSVPSGALSFFPDKPRLEESGCPGNQTWVEGMEQMLACVPKGNPTPSLVCTWNGMTFDLEVPQKATQNHTGTYCCMATNRLGSVSKDIAVIVQGDSNSPAARPRMEVPRGLGFLSRHGKKKDFSGLGAVR